MIYAYIRVSTDKQTVENQRFEIENYCRKRQIDVDQYIEETISGMKDVDKRKLGTLLKKMKKDDTLIASEISRLGRRLLEVMSILDSLMKKKIRVITVKEGFELSGDGCILHLWRNSEWFAGKD
jgi:DNA invertase Pin-like site-specific DNA recombinase